MFGDGSQTTPFTWWASLGGAGILIPNWNTDEEDHMHRREMKLAKPAIGQAGSSTRQELTAWIYALTIAARHTFATDSAAMLRKVELLIGKAARLEELERL